MFDFKDRVITKVYNPLQVTKSSLIEFDIGELKDTGLYRFNLIIEFKVGDRTYSRYLIYSISENSEYVFEIFPGNNGQAEAYLYGLADTVPFSEDFLDIVGQRFLTTPDGLEYQRCVMPDCEDRIEGISGHIRIYNIETGEIEKEYGVKIWDYQRDAEGTTEFINIEMSEENGMFKIFKGEMIEDIFFKFYQTSK